MIELYRNNLIIAMNNLSRYSDTLFVGQSVKFSGTGMYDSLVDIPDTKKIEFPVAENFQMGFCLGMSLNGFVPVSIYPRWNFLLCASDQLINHVDKIRFMSDNGYVPKIIIRVAVGSEIPVDPQDQHKGNFSEAFRLMSKNLDIIELNHHDKIIPAYNLAYNRTDGKVTILVEFSDYGK